MPHARLRRERAQHRAEDSRRGRAPAKPALAAGRGEDPADDREQPEEDPELERAHLQRRQGEPEGERAEDDPRDCYPPLPRHAHERHAPRIIGRVHDPAFRRRPRPKRVALSTSVSAPTNRTTRPWMIWARLAARSGRKMDGSSCRPEVPFRSAPKSSAASPTPTAVLRPSSATAIPTKPIVDARTSACPRRNCQPRMSIAPARPANAPEMAMARK